MNFTQNPSDNIIRGPDLDYTPDSRGLGYVLFESMLKNSEKVAQIHGISGEKDTYQSLLQRCTKAAIKLRSLGVTHEDVICVCSFNHLDSCVPYIATLFLGAKISALDPTLSLQDSRSLLAQVKPKIIFVDEESVELIEQAAAHFEKNVKMIKFGSSGTSSNKYETFDHFLQSSPEEVFEPHRANDLFTTAIIFFSSGTTGLPKGICIHHFAVLSQLYNYSNCGCCSDVYLRFASLYWVTSVFIMLTLITNGYTAIVVPKFNPEHIWNAIDKFKPTSFSSVPIQHMILCQTKPKHVDTSSLVNVGIGGGALIASQISDVQKTFPEAQIFPVYGQTEMCFAITLFNVGSKKHLEFIKNKPTSSGTVVPGIWYKVVDVGTEKILGPNEPGELRIKSKFLMNGYYEMDSSFAFDDEGWYKTGDLVYYDDDKCFYVLDRLKEFIKFQKWQVAPAFIESVLMQHPKIGSAVVIGVPHDQDENHLMALVVPKTTDSVLYAKDVEEFVEKRVEDRNRLRAGVRIVDHIPLGGTGKAKRREIADMVFRGEF